MIWPEYPNSHRVSVFHEDGILWILEVRNGSPRENAS